MRNATQATEKHVAAGVDVELIDLRTLRPLDSDTVIESVKKWKQAGATVVFTAKNQTHADHFRELLSDFDIQANDSSLDAYKIASWSDWLQAGLTYKKSKKSADGKKDGQAGFRDCGSVQTGAA